MTPPTIEAMMLNVGKSIAAFAEANSGVGIVELPLPVTGGTELDDWPGGIKQKYSTLRPMLKVAFQFLNFSADAINAQEFMDGENGFEDGIGIWKYQNINICCFPTTDCIPEILKRMQEHKAELDLISKLGSPKQNPVFVMVNPQFFLDPMSKEESKSFLRGCSTVYELTSLNMRGDGLAGTMPVRGILVREYPGKYRVGRRLDAGGYVLLGSYNEKPERRELEVLFMDDSKSRDKDLTLQEKLQKLVPNFGDPALKNRNTF